VNGLSAVRSSIIAGAALALALSMAPPALADTCCANAEVDLSPRAASSGDRVELTNLQCLAADNSGPLPFAPGAFWLWPGNRPADTEPDTTPGEGFPQDMPATDEWLPFDSTQEGTDGTGSAVITVPDVRDGRYQLWWWCDDGTGAGGGIHYSTGPLLTVGDPPDTATADSVPLVDRAPTGAMVALLLGVGATAFVIASAASTHRRRRRA
jgi:hypothetical protein